MTASSVDTAELSPVRPRVEAAPVLDGPVLDGPVLDGPVLAGPVDSHVLAALAPTTSRPTTFDTAVPTIIRAPQVPASVPPPHGRAAIVAERRLARRQRRLYAALGIAVMTGTLGATVIVLDVFH